MELLRRHPVQLQICNCKFAISNRLRRTPILLSLTPRFRSVAINMPLLTELCATARLKILNSKFSILNRLLLLFPLLLSFSFFEAPSRAQPAKEYDRRAACLYKLAEFVDWPAEAFASAESPIII